jgi:hypothetical protein
MLFLLFWIFKACNIVVQDVERVNRLKAANINMIPTSALQDVYDLRMLELKKVQDQILKAFDKNKFQIRLQNLNGLSIYTSPLSSNVTSFQGLGDVERGGAEKLKLLHELIEKQYRLAESIIEAKKALYREEYYQNNASIMVYENSLFDGCLVRWFSIKNSSQLNIVQNSVYYPNK